MASHDGGKPRAKLGELLVAARLLGHEQVQQALRAQVMWGGRLGTNLVELGCLDLDALSQALGRQHRLPAVLARHFDRADKALQRLLSPDFAEKFECVPLNRLPDGHVVVASVAPLPPKAIAILADELALREGARIIPGIAAELRIRYQLERAYRIPRSARFLRSRGKTIPPFPAFSIEPVADSEPDLLLPMDEPHVATTPVAKQAPIADDLAIDSEVTYVAPEAVAPLDAVADDEPNDFETITDLTGHVVSEDDLAVPTTAPEPERAREQEREREEEGRRQRRYLRTIADEPSPESERALGRIAIRRVAAPARDAAPGATLGEATRAIRRSTDRDRVVELIIDTLERFAPACDAAIVLVVRGDVAIGWKGFARTGAPLPEIVVPLGEPGLVPRVIERNCALREPFTALDSIDQLLLAGLGRPRGDLVVVPVAIGGSVMCVMAIATAWDGRLPDAAADPRSGAALVPTAESIAAAAGAAFARLMRDASR